MKLKTSKTQTLLYVGFVLLAVAMITTIVITGTISSIKTANQQGKGAEAYQLAMAGIERAKTELTANWDTWTMDTLLDEDPHRGDTTGLDETEALGEGQYWVRVLDTVPADPDKLWIISHGWVDDAHRIIEVEFQRPTVAALDPSLVAHYPFEGDATDLSIYENHGIEAGNIAYGVGKFGRAKRFDGNGDYVDCGTDPSLDLGGSFTISAWVNPTVLESYAGIVSKDSNRWSPYSYMAVTHGSYMGIFDNAAWRFSAPGVISANTWHHLVWVHQSGTVTLYVDRALVGTSLMLDTDDPNDNTYIGSWYSGHTAYDFNGYIDEVKIWNRALNIAEIEAENRRTDPIAHYPFEGNAFDASGNGNNGTEGGDIAYSTGKIDQAKNFDGSGDYALIPATSNFDLQDMTISCWTYSDNYDANMFMFEKTTNDSVNTQYSLFFNGGGSSSQIYFRTYGLSAVNLVATDHANGPVDGQYNHIAATYTSATGTKKIYCNGNEIATVSGLSGTINTNPAGTSWIGAYGGGAGYPFNGQIDDLKIWNRALTADEVRAEFIEGNDGLVAYYPFEGNANDLSGIGNHGTQFGNVSYGTGKFGRAKFFDGSGDYVDCGSDSSLDFSNAFTISAWINPTTLKNYAGVVSKDSNRWSPYSYMAVSHGSGYMGIYSGGWLWAAASPGLIQVNNWSHLTWVYQNNLIYFYIDGAPVGTSAMAYTDDPNDNTYIGSWYSGGTGYDFRGYIDEVKIWNKALSADEIAENYRGGVTAQSIRQGLVADYPFENNSWADLSGLGNDGTAQGGASFVADGQVGQAASFDGINDRVIVDDDPSISGLNAVTVSAWIRAQDFGVGGDYNFVATKSNWDDNREYRIRIENGNTLVWHISNDGNDPGGAENSIPVAGNLNLNQWHHLVGTYSDTDSLCRLYVDGSLKDTDTCEAGGIFNGTANLAIGGSGDNGASGNQDDFHGRVDEVKIWNRALGVDEIEWLYANEVGNNGLVAYYPLENSLADLSGNGNTATTNGLSFTSGKFGRGASFDGNDYMQVLSSASLPWGGALRTNYSIAYWFKTSDPYSGLHGVYSLAAGSNGHDRHLYLWAGNTYQRVWSNQVINTLGENYADSKWHHVVQWLKSGVAQRTYIDGKAVAAGSKHTSDFTWPDRIWFGHSADRGYFTGLLDDIRIYNRPLFDFEIKNLASGLVAYYPFEGNATDASGNGNHGTEEGGVSYSEAEPDRAAVFDGSNDCVSVNSFGNFETMTVSAMVYRTGATSARESIVSYKEGAGVNQGFVLCLNENGSSQYPRIYVQVNGVWRAVEQTVAIPLNTWVHLAASYDGTTIRLYRDGVQVASGNYAGSMTNDGSQMIGIGARASLNTYWFPGQIDEVKIWSSALGADDIKTEYIEANNGLVAYYPFEGDATDLSGLGNHGVESGNIAYLPGKFSQAKNFDGNNDYVNCGSDLSLDLGDSFTISAWINPTVLKNYAGIVSKDSNRGAPYSYLAVSHGLGYMGIYNNAVWQWSHPGLISTGKWQNVIWLHKNGQLGFFVDGVLFNVISMTYPDDPSDNTYIGSWSPSYDFNGLIDDVKIWNRAISDKEIGEIVVDPSSVSTPAEGLKPVSGTWGER
ncbi:MAG: LamG domain-containing protein [Candidatus Omnitrophica bacterium]|nr:LamG domain-containing protein [Candidatus Omnitrophota bacterium]